MPFSFAGFATPNTTPVPDQLFDELLAELSGTELKVLLYIIRRTFGFKKSQDNISLNQMLNGVKRKDGRVLDRGVGLSKPALLGALRSLVEKGVIVRERRTDAKRGNLPTCYRLNFSEEGVSVAPHQSSQSADPLGQKALPRVGKIALPTTRNRKTSTKNNVVKAQQEKQKPREQIDYLIGEMERSTGDTHSRGNFARIADTLPEHKLFQLLAEMRQSRGIQNRGAWLTAAAKKLVNRVALPDANRAVHSSLVEMTLEGKEGSQRTKRGDP